MTDGEPLKKRRALRTVVCPLRIFTKCGGTSGLWGGSPPVPNPGPPTDSIVAAWSPFGGGSWRYRRLGACDSQNLLPESRSFSVKLGRVSRNAVAPPGSDGGRNETGSRGFRRRFGLGITRRSPPRIPGVVCDHGTGWSDAAVVLDGAPSWLGIPTKWMVLYPYSHN